MDGLPGMRRGLLAGKRDRVAPIKKMVGPLAPSRYENGLGFRLGHVLLLILLSFLLGFTLASYGQLGSRLGSRFLDW